MHVISCCYLGYFFLRIIGVIFFLLLLKCYHQRNLLKCKVLPDELRRKTLLMILNRLFCLFVLIWIYENDEQKRTD
jgi:hypothetical protein